MNREEILRKAQNKRPNKMDEMELDILNRGCKVSFVAGAIACFTIMIVKILADVPYYDVYAIYCFMTGGQWFYKWVRLKKKSDLYYGILWCGLAIGLFINYLVQIF